jgi:hypothetical protein
MLLLLEWQNLCNMRVEIYPNFATQEELYALNEWAKLGVANNWLDAGITNFANITFKRLTSRLYGHRFNYPKEVLQLSEKIRKFVGVDSYPLITGHGRDGVVVSYTYPGGDVYKHRDPKSIEGLATLRCNILTQKADAGGVLYVDGQQISIEVGDLHCYLVSEHEHWATEVEGSTPRIMWMFGAHVPADDWNSGRIKGRE